MNVLSAKIALRDRSLLDVIDLALRFVVAHAKAFAKVTAIVAIPCFLASWVVAANVGWIAGWVTTASLFALAEAPFVALASRLVFDDDVPIRTVLGVAARALPGLLVFRLLQFFAIVFGTCLFLLPGAWAASFFFFGTEVIVLEGVGPGHAISRLQRLGANAFGDIVMAMLAMLLLYALATELGNVTGHAILEQLLQIRLHPREDEIGGPIALFSFWMAVPILTVARFFVYLNLRTRREGWDIQTRFAALAARAAGDAEPAA